jgi:hypothetical protein
MNYSTILLLSIISTYYSLHVFLIIKWCIRDPCTTFYVILLLIDSNIEQEL